jgi:peptide/nickel transport system substrate-binding protein
MRRRRGVTPVPSFLLIAVLLLGACAGGSSSSSTTQINSKATIRVGMPDMPPSAVPWTGVGSPGQYVWSQVYDALTYIRPDGSVGPMLATSWTTPDPNTWVFVLRSGATFSNGEKADAAAVARTFGIVTSPEGLVTYAAQTSNYKFIKSVTAPDPGTVRITTSTPNLLLPNIVSMVYIVPPAYWDQVGAKSFAEKPVGGGPFTVSEWTPDRITLERRAGGTFRGTAQAARIQFLRIADPAARFQALQSGQVEVDGSLSPDQGETAKKQGMQLFNGPTGQVMSLAMITNRGGPLADQSVRQAMNYAIDRDTIVKQIFHGQSRAGAWPMQGIHGYSDSRKPYPYDVAKARQLLTQAGYPNGFNMTAEVVVGSFPADGDTYQAMAGYLKAVGINVTLTQIDFNSQWLPKFTGRAKWAGDAFGLSWNSAPLIDAVRPFNFFQCKYSAAFFCDQQAQPLVEQVNSTTDTARRDQALQQLLDRTRDNPPAIWLIEVPGLWAFSSKVQGFSLAFYNIPAEKLALKT